MQIKQYLYQSPSTSSVQVGRLDPLSQQSNERKQSAPIQSKAVEEISQKPLNQSLQPIEPTVSASKIDIYA